MNKELVTFNSLVAIIGTAFAQALGGWDIALRVLVSLVVLDYVTGVVIAILQKTLSSEVGFKGLFKKMMIFALVYLAVLVDQATNANVIRILTIMFYIANEGISLLENAGRLGVPYPKALKDILIQLKESNDNKESEEQV